MNQLSFDFNGASVRVVMLDGEPWFVAKDVCRYFGDSDHKRSISRLDNDEISLIEVKDALGRMQNTTVINESGLYHLLFNFQPQQARCKDGGARITSHIEERQAKIKSFKRWVTHDVLPSIRKTGVYAVNQDHAELDINEELLNTTKALVLHINRQLLNGVNLPAGLLNYARTVCRTFCAASMPIPPPVAVDPEIMTVMDNLRRGVRYSRNTVYQDYCSRCSGVPKSQRAFWPCARKYCPFVDVRTAGDRYIILEED